MQWAVVGITVSGPRRMSLLSRQLPPNRVVAQLRDASRVAATGLHAACATRPIAPRVYLEQQRGLIVVNVEPNGPAGSGWCADR